MKNTVYFCYERDFANRWCGAMYDEPPTEALSDKRERSKVHKVKVGLEGITLDELCERYPPPGADDDADKD